MAQAQVLALFNATMKFNASETGAADSSLHFAPQQPSAKPPAPVFQIFQDGATDADKENAPVVGLKAASSQQPFAIFKDPTEKISVPKNVIGGGGPKLSGILRATVPPPPPPPSSVLTEKPGGNNENRCVMKDGPLSHRPLQYQQQQQQQQQLQSDAMVAEADNFGDITSFNPPESSTVNVASILKAQGVKSVRQLYQQQQQEPTVKFAVPMKQLQRPPPDEEDDDDVAPTGSGGGEGENLFGGVTEFYPPSCSTRNWQDLAKAAQVGMMEEAIGAAASLLPPPPQVVLEQEHQRDQPQKHQQYQQQYQQQQKLKIESLIKKADTCNTQIQITFWG